MLLVNILGTVGEPDGNLMGTIKKQRIPTTSPQKVKRKKVVSTLILSAY
jgi:hypothetical protein